MQFGFKRDWYTNMRSMILNEPMEYFVNYGRTVYCTLLDATKAFDRLNTENSIASLMAKELPSVLLKF